MELWAGNFNRLRVLSLYSLCRVRSWSESVFCKNISPDKTRIDWYKVVYCDVGRLLPMEEIKRVSAPMRFGVFEVDLQAGELRRQGFKVKLQEQPFQVLVMLLDRPGDVVTREELQKRLWPADTFVDFERGLNRAINKIREALADDAG